MRLVLSALSSQLSALSSQLSALSSATFVAAGLFAIPLAAQKQIFSTYDWTQSVGEVQFAEVWADVKTPGGFPEFGATPDSRRTYAVGTIEVRDARPNVLFSQSPAQPHDQAGFFLWVFRISCG